MSDVTPVPVEPSVITEVKTITSFKVSIQDLVLFYSVTLRCELLNAVGNLIDLRYIVLSGDDYTNWGNNDDYIVNTCAAKLGLVVKPAEPAPEEPAPAEPSA
jgi:hypothetical protein